MRRPDRKGTTLAKKLHVALVWHMHQPLYKDRRSGTYQMPWVRLHAQKDYLDMLAVLKPFPAIRQTFNLVPSLLEQLEDYAEHEAWDRPLALLAAPLADWADEDRTYMLERGFDLQWQHMLLPFARYAELADKRERLRELGFEQAAAHFSAEEFADLVTWFNLAWFDPHWLETEPLLSGLVAKGARFSEAERLELVAFIRSFLRRVVPAYRHMAASGQVELTTTPYYHPILPLLCDRDSALVARPHLPLPQHRFAYPEDARAQVERGLSHFEQRFGVRPAGMWPSEQSVSPQTLDILAGCGVRWAISDEGILAATLGLRLGRDAQGRPEDAARLYQPYEVMTPSGPVAMVFRDIVLSDLIGFTYAQAQPQLAAQDLVGRLRRIRQALPDGGEAYLVTIALDGENCWEHYVRDGWPFLQALYTLISEDPTLEMCTVGEYLAQHPPRQRLETIFSGSWIGSDFTTWIGDPTKNRAWDLLFEARAALAAQEAELAGTPAWEAAWDEIYIAEGSDWFWWFGEGHDSGQDERFDAQFRLHLQQVYALAGLEVPAALLAPLSRKAPRPAVAGHISPSLDGNLEPGEWEGAALYDPAAGQGAMHAAASYIKRLHVGHDDTQLYVAVEFSEQRQPAPGDGVLIALYHPGRPGYTSPLPLDVSGVAAETARFRFAHLVRVVVGDRSEAVLEAAGDYDGWSPVAQLSQVAMGRALELAVPFEWLGADAGHTMHVVVAGVAGHQVVEVLPPDRTIGVTVPQLEVLLEP